MHDLHIPVPKDIRITAELALNAMLRRALHADELNLDQIQGLLEDVRVADAPLDTEEMEMILRRNIERRSAVFFAIPTDPGGLRKFRGLVASARSLPLPCVLWSVQNLFFS